MLLLALILIISWPSSALTCLSFFVGCDMPGWWWTMCQECQDVLLVCVNMNEMGEVEGGSIIFLRVMKLFLLGNTLGCDKLTLHTRDGW